MLDVGSNTVHLLVVDAHPGARPLPAAEHRADLRLAELFSADRRLSDSGAERLVAVIDEARRAADELGVEDLAAFGTSALREATNASEVLARIKEQTGVELDVLDGDDEARLTFLAARRWFGWSAGRLLVVDIGGGSLEVATGADEDPEQVASLPLGASRLTRDWLPSDPPGRRELEALRRHVRTEIARHIRPFALAGAPDLAVGTSKTLRSLARIAGAAASSEGPYVRRTLGREQVRQIAERMSGMSAKARAKLPGVSAGRAGQLLAGAVVAEAAVELFDLEELVICPWALREGVILRRLDWVSN